MPFVRARSSERPGQYGNVLWGTRRARLSWFVHKCFDTEQVLVEMKQFSSFTMQLAHLIKAVN